METKPKIQAAIDTLEENILEQPVKKELPDNSIYNNIDMPLPGSIWIFH